MAAINICSDFGAQKIKFDTVSTVSPSISHEVMGPDAMIFIFWMQTPSSNNTREDSTHGHHQMVNTKIRLIIFFAAKDWRSSVQSAKPRLGADCGSDHELLIAKFRLKLKKVGKTPRPFRYDLNQIPYDYTVEVRNRFKGLDLIDKSAWWDRKSVV